MASFDKLRFNFWDPMEFAQQLINEWEPGDLKTEQQYEKSLYDFLQQRLDGIQITRQYARGRVRADIAIGDKVIVEIKNNLDSTSKYHRLVGQLNEYKDWNEKIIVVLCGRTDPNLLHQLRKHIEEICPGFSPLFVDEAVVISKDERP